MVIGYIIKHPARGYLNCSGEWSRVGQGLFLLPNLPRIEKVCKKFKGAVVVEIFTFVEGKVVFRQK